MTSLRLYKKEKLCSKTAIDSLFSPSLKKNGENNSIMAYPWRAVWRLNNARKQHCAQFLITVPKKRLRRAVDRVTMRRRLREAYRLSRTPLTEATPIDIAFIYVADSLTDYRSAARSISKILSRISAAITAADPQTAPSAQQP